VILVDANVLLYAYNTGSPQHDRCRAWLDDALTGTVPVALSWFVILAFVRLSTHARVFREPLTMSEAVAIVSKWMSVPSVVVIDPGERYWQILRELMAEARVAGPLVSDAALAALALEHGASVCTTDRDFKRFEGLRLVDPLDA
jgi:toxin-antitoxin system PIN domain toxin